MQKRLLPAERRRAVMRACRLACPACGGASAFRSWLVMRHSCSSCGISFDRGESDYFLGAMMLNLVIAESFWACGMLAAVLVTWPAPPWTALLYVGVLTMIAAPFIFYPFSKTLWLAVDLLLRPEVDNEAPVAPEAVR